MTRHDETTSEIRQALDREAQRRFDAQQLGSRLAARGRATAWNSGSGARNSKAGPLGRLPVAVQWIGLAAALLGAALGVRSFYVDLTRGAGPAPQRAQVAAIPEIPPGAGAATSNPSAAPAPTLHEAQEFSPAFEAKPQRPLPRKRADELVAGPAGAPDPAPSAAGAEPGTLTGAVAQGEPPATAPSPDPAGTSVPARPLVAIAPGIVSGSGRAPEESTGGVRVVSLRAGGRVVRPEIREAPEAGATLVIVPAAVAFSSRRGGGLRELPYVPAIEPAVFFAPAETSRREEDPVPAPEAPEAPEAPDGGAYYVRLFVGSGFEPGVPRSQGLMGDGLQVIPLRENEVWGDDEQEEFLAQAFRLTSITAVDGARVEPAGDDSSAVANFVAGVGGQLFGVSLQASPAETEGTHRIDVRLHRAGERLGDSSEGAVILAASLIVENGRIVVLGIPEPDDVQHPRRGPRVAFLALSPRFGKFERAGAAEEVRVIEGDVEPPVLVEKTQPVYTREALEQRAEGQVVLQAVIRKDGRLDGIQILRVPKVPGGEYLMESAARAVREWRYLPALLYGEPVNVYFTIVVRFFLSSGDGT